MKKNINVVMGGPSAEYEVSMKTGWEMFSHLDKRKYSIRVVVIDSNKNFLYTEKDPNTDGMTEFSNPESSPLFKGPVSAVSSEAIWKDCDIVLMALHGEYGEDGQFQGFLEAINMPYTGSKVFASAAGMEKIASKEIFEQNGIQTPPYSVFYTEHDVSEAKIIGEERGFPCFVKCPQSGSSRLMGKAHSQNELDKFIVEYTPYTHRVLIETGIQGEEFSCPVIEYPDGSVKALPPILIKPETDFFDFEAKYAGASEEIVPAPIDEELTHRIQGLALKAHRVLDCSGISRTDMIVSNDKIYVLETNTLPGFTSQSLLPKSFMTTGGTFAELLDILIDTELGRKK